MGLRDKKIERDKELFLKALEQYSGNIKAAGLEIGIKRPYHWVSRHTEKDSAFAEKYNEVRDEARNLMLDTCEEILEEKIKKDKNLAAVLYYLKCQGKARGWIEYKTMEGVEGNIVIKIEGVSAENAKAKRVQFQAADDVSKTGGNIQ